MERECSFFSTSSYRSLFSTWVTYLFVLTSRPPHRLGTIRLSRASPLSFLRISDFCSRLGFIRKPLETIARLLFCFCSFFNAIERNINVFIFEKTYLSSSTYLKRFVEWYNSIQLYNTYNWICSNNWTTNYNRLKIGNFFENTLYTYFYLMRALYKFCSFLPNIEVEFFFFFLGYSVLQLWNSNEPAGSGPCATPREVYASGNRQGKDDYLILFQRRFLPIKFIFLDFGWIFSKTKKKRKEEHFLRGYSFLKIFTSFKR